MSQAAAARCRCGHSKKLSTSSSQIEGPLTGLPLMRLALFRRAGQIFNYCMYWSCMMPFGLCHGDTVSAEQSVALIAGARVLVSACLPSLAGRLYFLQDRANCASQRTDLQRMHRSVQASTITCGIRQRERLLPP